MNLPGFLCLAPKRPSRDHDSANSRWAFCASLCLLAACAGKDAQESDFNASSAGGTAKPLQPGTMAGPPSDGSGGTPGTVRSDGSDLAGGNGEGVAPRAQGNGEPAPQLPRKTPPDVVKFGFTPTTVFVEDALASYNEWKEKHLEDCGGGVYRVRWENERLDATVSEGIGYGMLLTVIWDDRAAFDGLYAYYKLGQNPDTGLMHWLRYGCDAHHEETYSAFPGGAAADADLDVAMALLMGKCRWGEASYDVEATAVVRAIQQHMFTDDNGRWLLLPGDSGWFHQMGGGCVNYSYFAPAYYREFAKHDAENGAFWNKAADDSYTLLEVASNPTTGLVRNWGSADGQNATPACHDAYNRSASYGDDAARTPWRVVTDYLWNGSPAAKTWNDRVTAWVASEGIHTTAQWYHLDGTADTEANTWDDHTAINVGPWATGAMSYDQATVDSFAAEVLKIPFGKTDHDGEYFPRMLKALALATLAGKFVPCTGANR